MRNLKISIFVICVCGAVAGGCVSTQEVEPFSIAGRAWPEAPYEPRIVYVGEFSSARDLSIGEGPIRKLLSLTAGAAANALVRPMAVATAADGKTIFVADPDAGCVHRFDLRKSRYRCLTTKSSETGIRPVGLTVVDDSWLVVSDSSDGRLYRVGFQGRRLEEFHVDAMLEQPTGIHWDSSSQQLFVTDTTNQSVLVFDQVGNLKKEIGVRGSAPGNFNFPTYLWVDNEGDLFVTDTLNFRIQIFDADGLILGVFGGNGDRPGDFSRPKGVAVDSFGHIYVVDALMHTLQLFNRQGELLLVVGEQGQGDGQFWLPNGVFITEDNTIFVADAYNKRVQVFRYVGGEI